LSGGGKGHNAAKMKPGRDDDDAKRERFFHFTQIFLDPECLPSYVRRAFRERWDGKYAALLDDKRWSSMSPIHRGHLCWEGSDGGDEGAGGDGGVEGAGGAGASAQFCCPGAKRWCRQTIEERARRPRSAWLLISRRS
jgi:hypothetical protein